MKILPDWANLATVISLLVTVAALVIQILDWLGWKPKKEEIKFGFTKLRRYAPFIMACCLFFWIGATFFPRVVEVSTKETPTVVSAVSSTLLVGGGFANETATSTLVTVNLPDIPTQANPTLAQNATATISTPIPPGKSFLEIEVNGQKRTYYGDGFYQSYRITGSYTWNMTFTSPDSKDGFEIALNSMMYPGATKRISDFTNDVETDSDLY